MKEYKGNVKAVVEEDMYITEEEKEIIERFRMADDVTKEVILSLFNIKRKEITKDERLY